MFAVGGGAGAAPPPGVHRRAGGLGDDAARFQEDQAAGRHVPWVQVAFPVGVEPARRDEGEVERGRAEPPHARDLAGDLVQLLQEPRMPGFALERDAGGEQAIVELAPRRHAQPLLLS